MRWRPRMFTCCTLGVNSRKDAWCNLRRSEWFCQARTGGTVCRSGLSPMSSVLRGLCSFGLPCGGHGAGRPIMKGSPWPLLVSCVSLLLPLLKEGRTGKKEQSPTREKKNTTCNMNSRRFSSLIVSHLRCSSDFITIGSAVFPVQHVQHVKQNRVGSCFEIIISTGAHPAVVVCSGNIENFSSIKVCRI
jgi:hypothetical protein